LRGEEAPALRAGIRVVGDDLAPYFEFAARGADDNESIHKLRGRRDREAIREIDHLDLPDDGARLRIECYQHVVEPTDEHLPVPKCDTAVRTSTADRQLRQRRHIVDLGGLVRPDLPPRDCIQREHVVVPVTDIHHAVNDDR
jgi:hypothetical protein